VRCGVAGGREDAAGVEAPAVAALVVVRIEALVERAAGSDGVDENIRKRKDCRRLESCSPALKTCRSARRDSES